MDKTGGTLYAIRAEGTSLVKIGYTTTSVQKRLKSLQTGHPLALHVIETLPVESEVREKEALLHAFLATERRRGEINIQPKTLHRLAQALNTSVHYLYGTTKKSTHYCPQAAHPLYQMPCSVCPYQSRSQGAMSQEVS